MIGVVLRFSFLLFLHSASLFFGHCCGYLVFIALDGWFGHSGGKEAPYGSCGQSKATSSRYSVGLGWWAVEGASLLVDQASRLFVFGFGVLSIFRGSYKK